MDSCVFIFTDLSNDSTAAFISKREAKQCVMNEFDELTNIVVAVYPIGETLYSVLSFPAETFLYL